MVQISPPSDRLDDPERVRKQFDRELSKIERLVSQLQSGVEWPEQKSAASTLQLATVQLSRVTKGENISFAQSARASKISDRILKRLPEQSDSLSPVEKQSVAVIKSQLQNIKRRLNAPAKVENVVETPAVHLEPWMMIDAENLEQFEEELREVDAALEQFMRERVIEKTGPQDAPYQVWAPLGGLTIPNELSYLMAAYDHLTFLTSSLAQDTLKVRERIEGGKADQINEADIRSLVVYTTAVSSFIKGRDLLTTLATALDPYWPGEVGEESEEEADLVDPEIQKEARDLPAAQVVRNDFSLYRPLNRFDLSEG